MPTEVSQKHQKSERKNDVLEQLKKIAKNVNYANPRFHVSPGSAKGENFLSDIYRTTIEGERDGKFEKLYSIVKCVPEFQRAQELFKSPIVFGREIMFYREVVPIFKKLLQEHDLELENIPKFYSVNGTSNKEIIVLEDLREKNYELRDRLKLLDYPHASLVLRSLGRFHAYSFALRDKHPKIFQKLQSMEDTILEVLKNPTEPIRRFIKGTTALALQTVSNEDPYYVKRIEGFFENVTQKMVDASDSSPAEPYATLCHGDAWTNNFLFKYDDEAKTNPTSLYLLDFQLCRYASPITDVMYTLFCCCSQKTRRENYEQLLLDYYESLSNFLKRLRCDPEVLFPYEIFQQQVQKYGFYGPAMVTFALHVQIDTSGDFGDMMDVHFSEKLEERLKTDTLLRDMIVSAFIDAVDKNYI